MFARAFAVLPLAFLASASHLAARQGGCSTGSIQCCNTLTTIQQASNVLSGLNLLDVAFELGGLVGQGCSPITGIGEGGNKCSEQTACCDNYYSDDLIGLGCDPING